MTKSPFLLGFSGNSGVGKSSFVSATQSNLEKGGKQVVVCSENELDRIRNLTGKIIKKLREFAVEESVAAAALFAAGRGFLYQDLLRQHENVDVLILDRCLWDSAAYQGNDGVSHCLAMRKILELNLAVGVPVPDLTIIVQGDSFEDCDLRRAYRDKKPIGTAGMMSGDRNNRQRIESNFLKLPTVCPECTFRIVKNSGTATQDEGLRLCAWHKNYEESVLPILLEFGLL